MNYSFFRIIKFAIQDFYRNFWLSIVTITVLILALFSVNILVSLNAISDSVISSVKDKVDVSVFFQAETPQAVIDNFQQKIVAMDEVDSVLFIGKNEALDSFKEKHSDDPALMEALKEVEQNPLLDALIVKATDTAGYNKILSTLNLPENQEVIKYQNYTDHEKIINRVSVLSDKIRKFSLSLTVIFSIIAILIVFNAIRVTIYTHREEIAVMRLVGASNSFIRAPFLVEGIIFALVSVCLASIALYVCFIALTPYLSGFLETYNFSLIGYYQANFWQILLSQIGAVILLNIVSAGVAIGKHLRV